MLEEDGPRKKDNSGEEITMTTTKAENNFHREWRTDS